VKYGVITSNLGGTRPTVVCSVTLTLDNTKGNKCVCMQVVALLSTIRIMRCLRTFTVSDYIS
jgi:hypothetical protein